MFKSAVFAVSLAMAGGVQAQSGPSFDCDKAASKVEKMICQSPELAELDSKMAAMYKPDAGKWYVRLHAAWLVLGALDIAKDQASLIREQQGWRKLLDQCADLACVKRRYAERQAVLKAQKTSVARAAMKKYADTKLGIGFDYLENRTVERCEDADCVRLTGVAMSDGSPMLLEIRVQDGSLTAVADAIWERRGARSMAAGRFSEAEVAQYGGPWKGLQATTECSFRDRNGIHAAGECNTYLRSNGKRSIVISDTAASGKDAAGEATIASVHFLR